MGFERKGRATLRMNLLHYNDDDDDNDDDDNDADDDDEDPRGVLEQ